jgi:hypothetical protein
VLDCMDCLTAEGIMLPIFCVPEKHQPPRASPLQCEESQDCSQQIGQNDAICRDDETSIKPCSRVVGRVSTEIRCDHFAVWCCVFACRSLDIEFIFGELQLSLVYLDWDN